MPRFLCPACGENLWTRQCRFPEACINVAIRRIRNDEVSIDDVYGVLLICRVPAETLAAFAERTLDLDQLDFLIVPRLRTKEPLCYGSEDSLAACGVTMSRSGEHVTFSYFDDKDSPGSVSGFETGAEVMGRVDVCMASVFDDDVPVAEILGGFVKYVVSGVTVHAASYSLADGKFDVFVSEGKNHAVIGLGHIFAAAKDFKVAKKAGTVSRDTTIPNIRAVISATADEVYRAPELERYAAFMGDFLDNRPGPSLRDIVTFLDDASPFI